MTVDAKDTKVIGRVNEEQRSSYIPVYQPFLNGNEKKYVNECLDSSWISSKGEFIQRFEDGFGKYIGAKNVTSVCNGTVAIHLALDALGIGPGDEVIVPALTYVASVNTILQTGATPIFVDSLEGTWQVDPEDIKRKISPKTKAVMVVHLYGLPCDMDPILSICEKYGLLLVEDAAEAVGTLYKGQHVGTFGDIATFSFFGNKTITTGEGGMVVAKDASIMERAYHLKTQGVSREREYWHDVLGYNYRMTNLCAAIGLAQLEQVDLILQKKRDVANAYEQGLRGLPVNFHQEQAHTRHSFWMCSISVDDPSMRAPLRDHLKSNGIETRPLFHPAHKLPHCATADTHPIAESLSARGINLPSYPGLTQFDTDAVIQQIKKFYSAN